MRKLLKLLMVISGCFIFLYACKSKPTDTNYYLVQDTVNDTFGYINASHDTVIPMGKYDRCFTDTFKNYAIVAKRNVGFLAINKQEQPLYEVFEYDNGPDYVAEGLFRIMRKGKIGYADSTGKVVIQPRYTCAYPFSNGVAEVSYDGREVREGEHTVWVGAHWFYINKAGQQVKPK